MLPLATSAYANTPISPMPKKTIKPNRLNAGDTIGVIAPSSGIDPEDFDYAIENLHTLGFKTKIGKYAAARNGFLAGTDQERLEDLHWAFSDPEVRGIWCIRGGYGASRILPYINYKLIKRNPKVLIGYSDITALHFAIQRETGLVTFHGPVASSKFTEYTRTNCLAVLTNPKRRFEITLAPEMIEPPEPIEGGNGKKIENTEQIETDESSQDETTNVGVIRAGTCRGELIGGNLSLVVALAGTDYSLNKPKNKILFLEDVGESPYRIDRMLTQLRESSNLRKLSGIALGHFTEGGSSDSNSQSTVEVLTERLGTLGIPVIYGLSFGHIKNQCTLPIGIEAELSTERQTITLLEPAVK